jgi:competence protein ComEA
MRKLLLALAAMLVSTAAFAAVNINTATKEELVALNGIGPAKAQAILDYRAKNGPYKTVEDVRKVKGIGEKLFARIQPELTVSGPTKVAAAPGPAAAPKPDAKPSRSDTGKVGK